MLLTHLAGHVYDGLYNSAQSFEACHVINEFRVRGNAGNLLWLNVFTNACRTIRVNETCVRVRVCV